MIQFFPSGDSAFLLKFGHEISEDIHKKIRAYIFLLDKNKMDGIVEWVPSYTDLLVHYDPLKIDFKVLLDHLKSLMSRMEDIDIPEAKTVRVPVLYGKSFGEDMDVVVTHTGLNKEEIVKRHTSVKYLVYMLGFTPGFCYLGGMDQALSTPRKEVPSQKILAGAVGIAGNQTGIYPIESPGGWQIIGRTPLKLFDPEKKNPFLVEAGDYLEFYAITSKEYEELNEND